MTTARSPSRKRRRPRFLLRVLTSRDVRHADRRASLIGDDDLPELLDALETPGRPQHHFGVALIDTSARDLDVLGCDRLADLAGAQPVG